MQQVPGFLPKCKAIGGVELTTDFHLEPILTQWNYNFSPTYAFARLGQGKLTLTFTILSK